jgi:hypothetical protein
MVWCLWDGV